MKSLLYSSLFFILVVLQTFKLSAQEIDTELLSVECEIVRIDSVGNHYVIYAKDSSDKYKIVVEKDSTMCQNIVVGQFYELTLDPGIRTMNVLDPISFPGGATIIPYG